MIVRLISFASPPWLMEFPLDIHVLKEMSLLPLLYPEVFQRFRCYPSKRCALPRTPKNWKDSSPKSSGSGRSEQAVGYVRIFSVDQCIPLTPPPNHQPSSCVKARTASPSGSEAERQSRSLFEEADISQPSNIFFDEIAREVI